MSFAEANCTFAPQPGLALTGSDNLAAQRRFVAFGLPMTLTVRHTLVAGDVAPAIVDWSMKGTAADGTEVDMGGTAGRGTTDGSSPLTTRSARPEKTSPEGRSSAADAAPKKIAGRPDLQEN